jgi:hypothetical protein
MLLHLIQVSPEDEHLLNEHRWRLNNYGYVVRYEGGTRCKTPIKAYLLHRVIVGAQPGQIVDHINGDKLDNRRENLRICSHAENMRNRRKHKNNTTGYPNVERRGGKYLARVRVNGKTHKKCGFDTPEAAYEHSKAMVAALHGQFSKHEGCLQG